ncbi:hypothetical protein [Kribbella sp. NPDC006257]|uniref:hypothetical protein n=1 Tax=Kribbella sp. NPDC006257 TaxID=3156738 RepID=UPI0033BFA0CB
MWVRGRRRGAGVGGGVWAGRLAVVPVVVLGVAMLRGGGPALDVAKFVGFVGFGVTLPGIVLWRLIGNYRRNLVEDFAAGFAVGCAVQLLVYLAFAEAGLQRWSWVWGPIVLLVGAFSPVVRRKVWRRVEDPLTPLAAWLLSASCLLVVFVIYAKGPRYYAPGFAKAQAHYPDMAFHQALAASAKSDVPIVPLWVSGEPMKYQTFFHQITAATSWATGINLTNLVYSLMWLPLALAGCALVFVLTQRFLTGPEALGRTGTTWAGPLAVVLAGIGGTLQPLPEAGLGGMSMASSAYASPTQNFGVMLSLLLAVVAIDLLRDPSPKSRWILLVLIAVAASGAKATVVPLAVCGFGLVLLFRLFTRSPFRAPLVATAAMLVVFAGSVLIIFGGESSGLQVKFGSLFTQLQPYATLRHGTGLDRSAELLSAATSLTAWGLAIVGVLFLRRFWRDPATPYLVGAAIGAIFATLLTSQPGISQIYFYRTALPFLAVLSCVGLVQLVHRLGDRRAALLVPVGAALGVGACAIARLRSNDLPGVKGPMLWMLGALLVAALLIAAGWKLSGRPGSRTTAFLVAFVATCTIGATTLPLEGLVSKQASVLAFGKIGLGGPSKAERDAARWIYANSDTDDVVATNVHCLFQHGNLCDSRHFWIAALSERQMLVEGWAYTNKANSLSITTGVNPSVLPFWNKDLLAANNTAFTAPTQAAIDKLRQYGVRWLYVDRRAGVRVSPMLSHYAQLRHTTAGAQIYELR